MKHYLPFQLNKNKMKKIFEIGNILYGLRILFTLLTCISFVVLVFQIHEMICHCSPQSFGELISNPLVLKFLLIACFGLLTLFVAGKQLQKQTDVATITGLIELRKLLTSERNRQVHFALSDNDDKTSLSDKGIEIKVNNLSSANEIPMIDIYNYLGTIELGVEMVKRNLIDINTFYSQFGYRIENIFEKEESDVHAKVREHINGSKSYYHNLLWGYNQIYKKFIKSK